MAEAIISRRGYGAEGKPQLMTQIIASNQTWTVPNSIKGSISVIVCGGGGGQCYDGGGGGAWVNTGNITLASGTKVQITIGQYGTQNVWNGWNGDAGGTTSFGTWFSANGGGGARMDWEVVEHLEVEETMEEQAINLEVEVEEAVVLAEVEVVDHMEEVEDVDGILEEMDMNLFLPVIVVLMVEVAVIHSLEEIRLLE